MNDEPQAKPKLTKSDLSALNQLMIRVTDINRKMDELKKQDADARAAILEIVAPLIADDDETGREVFDGVTVQIKTDMTFDKVTALNWAIDEKQLPSAAGILKISKEAMPTAINLLVKAEFNPGLVFDLDIPGYESMLRSGVMTGCPAFLSARRKTLALKTTALKTGAELEALFDIIAEAEPAPVTEAVKHAD